MNIAFFSESYKPYISGVTNSIETLKKGLEALGHKVIVFSPSYPGSVPINGVYRFPSMPAPYPGYRISVPVPGKYFRMLKEMKIDIIHSHSPYQLGLLSMSYAKLMKVPFVFTMHTILGQYMHYVPLLPESISRSLMSGYIKWFCNRCDQIVVPTKKVKQQLHSTGVKTGMHIIPTGLDLSLIGKASLAGIREKHGIPGSAKLLLFVGRLASEKNLFFLLRAFESIREKLPDAHLLIAAGGPLEAELKGAAGKNITFVGAIGYPEVFDYYVASDLFVFSSLSETQGLVLAEAMSAGLPQVAIDAEGVSDVVKDKETGYLVRPSENEFRDAAIKILNDPSLREAMSRASRDAAREIYSMEAFSKKIELLYDSML